MWEQSAGGPPINARGSFLILSLLAVGMVAIVSGGMLTRSAVEQRSGALSMNRATAFHLSESGLDLAISELQANPDYLGATYPDMLGKGRGGYDIEVLPDGADRRIVRSTGFYPLSQGTSSTDATRTIEAVVQITKRAGPGDGILGTHAVRFDGWDHRDRREGDRKGLSVDGYDSRRGQGQGARLSVCTNGHEEKALTMFGGVTINGDVVLGPGSDLETTLWRVPEKHTVISGTVRIADTQAPVEPVDMPLLPDGGRLAISGDEVVSLPGGLHRFREIQISGSGRLVFTGRAEVYVEEVKISGQGGIDTAGQLPTNLTLYVLGPTVSLRGDRDLFAKILAPEATITLSGHGDLYGAVTGREVLIGGGSDLHYDAALNVYDEALNPPRQGDPPYEVRILSWRESGSI